MSALVIQYVAAQPPELGTLTGIGSTDGLGRRQVAKRRECVGEIEADLKVGGREVVCLSKIFDTSGQVAGATGAVAEQSQQRRVIGVLRQRGFTDGTGLGEVDRKSTRLNSRH